jgi:mono/diheme cytochrome c family protein
MGGSRSSIWVHRTTVRRAWSATASVILAVGAGACGQGATESAADRGSGLYRANCAVCHGDALDGTTRGPSLLEGSPVDIDDTEMADVIRNGIDDSGGEYDGMPGNGALRPSQVDELVAFVRTRQAAATE